MALRVYNWPAQQDLLDSVVLTTVSAFSQDNQAVVATTVIVGAGNIPIDGTRSNEPTIPTAATLSDAAVIGSNVSVTSSDNISTATFTITGFYLGLPQTDRVTGVNAGTVYTNELFTTVTNVSVDMSVSNFSIGKGGAVGSNAAASLLINGTYSNYLAQVGPYTAKFKDMIRTVSFTSNDDLSASGITLTIIGTYLGNVVQDQTLTAGNLPNNNTVQTTQIFDSVTQVIVSGGTPTNFNIGMGLYGMLQFFNFDFIQEISAFSVQILVSGTINYSFGLTSQKVSDLTTASPDSYFGVTPPVNPPAGTPPFPVNQLFLVDATSSLTNQTASAFSSTSLLPFLYATLLITEAGGGPFEEAAVAIDDTGTLQAYFLQGGI